MASKQFTSLPEREKIKYVKSIGRSRSAYRQLSSAERKEVAKNTGKIQRKIRTKEIKERVNKFFTMSEEEQNKYLDERIAQSEKWRKAREARRAQSKNSTNRNSGNRNAWRQGFLEGMDSTTRAQMAEIRRRMRERRKKTQKK